MLKLIINADDFGISPDVNLKIYEASNYGILTSATIIAGAKSFEEAADYAKQLDGKIGIGVHLALTGPFNINTKPNSIIDSGGQFKSDIINQLKYFKVKQADLIDEYSKQVEKILSNGITPTHLDHHHHLHKYKPALDAMISVAKKFGIKYIRSQVMLNRKKLLSDIYRNLHQSYLSKKLNTIDGYFDFGGVELKEMLVKLNKLLTSDHEAVEIMLHPGHPAYIDDYVFLTSEKVLAALNNCRLINYGTI